MFFSNYKKPIRLIAFILLGHASANAQQTRPLDLRDAILLAKQHSSQLRADSLQYRITGTQVSQVSSNALPQVNVNSTFQRLSNNITPYTIDLPNGAFQINPQILNQSYNAVQLTQLLYGGGKVKNSKRALAKEADAGKADYDKSVLALEQQVTDLWFNLYNARKTQNIIMANIKVLSEKRNDLDKFRVQGIVLANDVLKLDLQVTGLRSSLADLNSLAGSLNYNLCITTGLDPSSVIGIPESYIKQNSIIQPLQAYIDAALNKRPELKGFKFRSEAAAYRIKATQADYLPTLNLIGSYNYDKPNQRVFPNVNSFNYSALAGLSLSWRISSLYTNRPRVSESRLMALQLESTTRQVKEYIQQEVNARYLEYLKTQEKLTLTQTELEQANENFRVEGNKLNAQTTTPTDFLTANTQLLQAQLNLATAKANAELAYHKLMQSTGETAN